MQITRLRARWQSFSLYRFQVALPLLCLSLIMLLMSGCGSDSSATPAATATPVAVNGFGTAVNHGHSLLALSDNVLLMATHYGLFRSLNGGQSWSKVAAGTNQPMEDLMTYSLVASPRNSQRLYVLTQIVFNTHRGTLGLYTSSDEGTTWKLAQPTESTGNIYTVTAGNDSPDEVYIYLQTLGAKGLEVSMDDGQHFTPTGQLPFPDVKGILIPPGTQHELLVYGDDGIARSTDGGKTWQTAKGPHGSIYTLGMSKEQKTMYASGSDGIFVSQDDGKTFSEVNQSFYSGMVVSPTQPNTLYGKTAQHLYKSSDGGKTWQTLPEIKGNYQDLAPDPLQASQLYLSLSYPAQVYRLDLTSKQWTSLTPKA